MMIRLATDPPQPRQRSWRMLLLLMSLLPIAACSDYDPERLGKQLCLPLPLHPRVVDIETTTMERDYTRRYILDLDGGPDEDDFQQQVQQRLCEDPLSPKECGCWHHYMDTYVFQPSDEAMQDHLIVEAVYFANTELLVITEMSW